MSEPKEIPLSYNNVFHQPRSSRPVLKLPNFKLIHCCLRCQCYPQSFPWKHVSFISSKFPTLCPPKCSLNPSFPPHPLSNPFFANIFFLSSPALAKIALWLQLFNHQHGTWPWRNPPLEFSAALFYCHFPPDGTCVYAQMVVRTSDYRINEGNLGNFMNELLRQLMGSKKWGKKNWKRSLSSMRLTIFKPLNLSANWTTCGTWVTRRLGRS
ncbi:protein-like [Gossypium australe]|uniref:Protein-like n=1 Tax=Gossypium australe TaxID=47621 RepID=A0A5B6UQF6_9ROSI|nr:protein-like [Gossypium australe]